MDKVIHKRGRTRTNLLKHNKALPLADFLVPFVGNRGQARILDVGSGPFSIIGSYLPGVNLEIHHCDKNDFVDFWNTQELEQFVPIEVQNMEALTYDNESFDIVCCINALDHTKNAKKAVEEMVRVCKIGGWVYINCSLDQHSSLGGWHYWDAKADGRMEGPRGSFALGDMGFGIQFVDEGGETRYNKMIATLQKTGEVYGR